MSNRDHWMPLYVGDYLADTMHLSAVEHGAYLLLLMHQWRTGPLPDDDRLLAAIARCDAPTWRRIGPTVRAFFTATEDGLSQSRLERIRETQSAKVAQRAAAGKASAEARKAQREVNETSTSVAILVQREGREPEPEPEPERDLPVPAKSLPRAKRAAIDASNSHFADFWAAYPRKVGKGAAEKAFASAIAKGASVAEIATGLNRQKWPEDARFVPHPATWLNQLRWQDDPAAAAPETTPAASTGKLDWLWSEMGRKTDPADFPDFTDQPRKIQ